MRKYILILAIVSSFSCFAQEDTTVVLSSNSESLATLQRSLANPLLRASSGLRSVDNYVDAIDTKGHKGKDIEYLAHLLTDSLDNDSLKMRAIFYWIATNLSYDVKKYHGKMTVPFRCHCKKGKKRDHRQCIEKWHWELAREALVKKQGVCMDYALLFYYMCDFAEIECRYITGYAANGSKKLSTSLNPKSSNHAWNAVLINGTWHLLDVTWASGYCDKGVKQFTREQNDFYYLTPPSQFIADHHPVEKRWQLLNNPISMKEFITIANNR